MLGQVGPMLSHRAHVAPSWVPSWANVGPRWVHVGAIFGLCWPYVGPMLAYARPMLAHVEPSWHLCWPTLNHLGTYVGAMFGPSILRCQFLRHIPCCRNTETSVGGRAGSAYNLRLPPKASGKDTGRWPAPGLNGLPGLAAGAAGAAALTSGRRPRSVSLPEAFGW